ncbi:hypothetical protein BDV25DRAFT_132229 [Aspergillus avenaceus]|uniref:Protein kinase domain-containing protein n=1 Tax=Aspergillus avenaceus TaxID=36643 RepID=A0A5N6TLQ2_ASPAV|nr:hypothetical protein BDV25DRAFT_132229 [Aspergillus avenaceus]
MTKNIPWHPKEIFYSQTDKSARISIIHKSKCFDLPLSHTFFHQSPSSLQTYNSLMDSLCSDDDLADAAEEDLRHWAISPFLPFLDGIPPSLDRTPLTLHEYRHPDTYRLLLCVENEKREPRFDYRVPGQLRPEGVDVGDFIFCSGWGIYSPEDIEIKTPSRDKGLASVPSRVCVGDTVCFFKPVEYTDKRATLREMTIYKKLETGGISSRVRVPRLIGLVLHENGDLVIGLLLTLVECNYKSLECVVRPETPSALRMKWDAQVTDAVSCLHEAGIIWGDVKAANALIDDCGDAWVVDFGGGYTRGWVSKENMETVKGDLEGLSRIKEFVYR